MVGDGRLILPCVKVAEAEVLPLVMRVSEMTLSVEGPQRSLNLAVAAVVGAPGGSVRSFLNRSGRCSG